MVLVHGDLVNRDRIEIILVCHYTHLGHLGDRHDVALVAGNDFAVLVAESDLSQSFSIFGIVGLVDPGTHVQLLVLGHVSIFELAPTTEVVETQTLVSQLYAALATDLPNDGLNRSIAVRVVDLDTVHL